MFQPYLLASQAQHSNNDIKCIYCCNSTEAGCPKLLTASRDLTCKSWMLGSEAFTREDSCDPSASPVDGEVDSLIELQTMSGHTDYLQCCAEDPSGNYICTGSNDRTVRVWQSTTGSLVAVLAAHEQSAKCLTFITDGTGRTLLVSGGWDGKCAIWDVFGSRRLLYDIIHHDINVMAIARLPTAAGSGDLVLTTGGDKKIMLWDPSNHGKALMQFSGHTDAVQTLAVIDSTRFVSGGNDGDILVWDVPSDAARHLQVKKITSPQFRISAHESLVYSVAYDADSKLLFSGSEDKTVKIWAGVASAGRGSEAAPRNVQVILQPSIVWTVCVVKGTRGGSPHFACAGGDGVMRVWTSDRDLIAKPEVMDAFEAAVSAHGGSSGSKRGGGGGGEGTDGGSEGIPDPATLPTADQLPAPQRDGQRAFVRGTAGEVELYTAENGQWQRLGTVVTQPDGGAPADSTAASSGGGRSGGGDPPPPRKRQIYKGKAYDYLFPIAIGSNSLSLPYNAGESVYDAAQIFIYDHAHLGVSQSDREEIQQHIISQLHPADRELLLNPQSAFAREAQHRGGNSGDRSAAGASSSSSSTASSSQPAAAASASRQPLRPKLFDAAANTKQVCGKLGEYGIAAAATDVAPLFESIVTSTNDAAVAAAAHTLLASPLFRQLQDGQRMPYYDIVRVIALRSAGVVDVETLNQCVHGAVGAGSGGDDDDDDDGTGNNKAARDRDRIMAMRALANIVSTCPHLPVFKLHSDLIVDVRRVFLAPDANSPLLRGAALNFLYNVAARFEKNPELEEYDLDCISKLLLAVGAWLTIENDDAIIMTLVQAASALLLSPHEVTRAIAASGASDILGPEISRLVARWPNDEGLLALQKALG